MDVDVLLLELKSMINLSAQAEHTTYNSQAPGVVFITPAMWCSAIVIVVLS